MSGMCSAMLHKVQKVDYITARDVNWPRPAPWPRASFQHPWRTMTALGSAAGWKPILLQATDIFFLIVAPKRTGRESKVLEGPSMCRVWGRAEKTTEDNMNSYAAASIVCVLAPWKFSFHFSHFLWIQSHSYHLFKLRVRSTVLYLIASGARNEKQRRLVSPHRRLRFPHFFFPGCFIWLTTSRGQKPCSVHHQRKLI